MRNKKEGTIDFALIFIIIIVAVSFIGIFISMVFESQDWEDFKVEHDCTLVTEISGDIITTIGIDQNGKLIISTGITPSKKGWTCNNGKMYYR